jgi:hypothetical protein
MPKLLPLRSCFGISEAGVKSRGAAKMERAGLCTCARVSTCAGRITRYSYKARPSVRGDHSRARALTQHIGRYSVLPEPRGYASSAQGASRAPAGHCTTTPFSVRNLFLSTSYTDSECSLTRSSALFPLARTNARDHLRQVRHSLPGASFTAFETRFSPSSETMAQWARWVNCRSG